MIKHSPPYQMTLVEKFPCIEEELFDNEKVRKHALQMTESVSTYISMLDNMDDLHEALTELGMIHQQENIQALYIDVSFQHDYYQEWFSVQSMYKVLNFDVTMWVHYLILVATAIVL